MRVSESPESVLDIHPGTVLAGKYRVERILGTGGMGTVVAAHHLQLDERVALKFLLPQALGSMEAVARFMREARAAVKIKSEHVARVTDVGQLENGAPYMVMEYLDGRDLAAWLTQCGPMPIEQAVDFVLQASEALAEAHALGIVHRDLKPANLFCVQRSDGLLSIKVLDFGISKITNPADRAHAMTKTNSLAGSPLYMSPEHMKSSRTVDARTDIWSLGVILFELIAGRPPFEAEAVTELVMKVAADPPTPLRRYRPDAPVRLEAVVARCLEKDRNNRYQTVAELAVALAEFAPPQSRHLVDRIVGTVQRSSFSGPIPPLPLDSSPALPMAPPPSAVPANTIASWGEAGAHSSAGGKALIALAVGMALAVVGVLTAILWPRLSAAPPPETVFTAVSATPALSAAPAAPPPPPPPVDTAPPPVAPATAVAVTPPPAPEPTPQRVTTGAPSSQPTRPPPAPARPSCNPPYTVDRNGTRHFKRECL